MKSAGMIISNLGLTLPCVCPFVITLVKENDRYIGNGFVFVFYFT